MQTELTRPPGPPPRDGLVDSLVYYYRFFNDSIGTVRQRFEQYGDIYYAPSGGVGLYVIRHPDHIKQVLVSEGQKYGKTHSAFERLERVFGKGLLNTDGEVWRRQRRMVNPAFTSKRLAGYARAMVDEAVKLADSWGHGQQADVSREMMELTLRIVCRTLFSHDVRGQSDAVASAMEALRTMGATPDVLPRWAPSPMRQRMASSVSALNEVIYGMIRERRRLEVAPEGDVDLLHMLVSARDEEGDGAGLEDVEIRDQLVTLFIAGHETTSHALSWTWKLLSEHAEVEAKLHRELAEVLGGRVPTYEDLGNLPYTAQVLDEAMRLYPPAYTLARCAEEDTEIGGYPVPKGSEVVIWTYWTHHDSRWYPDPERFDPERFTPAEVAKRPKLAYLPFGAGGRACIGKMFALVEARLVLATLAQRFRLRRLDDGPVAMSPRITLSPKHGLPMNLQRR
jgi:cytochrome P450